MKNFLFFIISISTCMSAGYIPIDQVSPGQLRFSAQNVEEKIAKALKAGHATKIDNTYALSYNNHTSSIPETAALPVILLDERYVLVDGHHDILAALALGSTTVPVKIVDTLESKDTISAYEAALEKGYIYPITIEGTTCIPLPPSFGTLVDDPNRWLATLLARKCKDTSTRAEESISMADQNSYVYNYPVFIKDERKGIEVPFIEFKIADLFYAHGICYDLATHGNNPPTELVEECRRLLKAYPIAGIRVIEEPVVYTAINNGALGSFKEELLTR